MTRTERLGLPLLASGQAGKEMTVNEALALIDAAVQPIIAGVADLPPAAPAAGESWLVGAAAGGAWAGQAHAIAGWTASGWRFVPARRGMTVWDGAMQHRRRFDGTGWAAPTAIAAPAGGTMVDVQARAAIAAILAELRAAGAVSTP